MTSWRFFMKNEFTPEQIELLEKNRYTLKVTSNMIKYTDEFKEDFWRLYLANIPIREIFDTLGYDSQILGTKRMEGFVYNLRKAYLTCDQRKESQSRTSKTKRPPIDLNYSDMKSSDAIRVMQTELTYLRQEVDFLKKLYTQVPPSEKGER